MIVLSAGLPKSGTGWYYNLTNDLLIAAGLDDARKIRDDYSLHGILDGLNCRLARKDLISFIRVVYPHFRGHSYAIKSHAKPRRWLKLGRAFIRPTYIFRDPRDVAVSAFDNGRMMRKEGIQHNFAKLETMEDAIRLTRRWLKLWDLWSRHKPTLFVRYEDLLSSPLDEMQRLAAYLRLQVPDDRLHRIIARYQKESDPTKFEFLHFNQGVRGRYAQSMTQPQIAYAEELFWPWLERMGYS